MGGLGKQKAIERKKHRCDLRVLGVGITNLITSDDVRKTSTLNVNFEVDDEEFPFAHLQRRWPPPSWLIIFQLADNLHKHETTHIFPVNCRESCRSFTSQESPGESFFTSASSEARRTRFSEKGTFAGGKALEQTRSSRRFSFKLHFVDLYSFSYLISIPVVSTSRTYA